MYDKIKSIIVMYYSLNKLISFSGVMLLVFRPRRSLVALALGYIIDELLRVLLSLFGATIGAAATLATETIFGAIGSAALVTTALVLVVS